MIQDIRQIPASAAYGLIELTNPSGLRIQLLPGGEVFAIRHGATLINQVIPTPLERGMHRLVLRDRSDGAFGIADLTAPGAQFASMGARQAGWRGVSSAWEHTVTLALHPRLPLWVWQVQVRNCAAQARTFDLLHGQDLGLADEAGVRGNEAFSSHQIDHCPVTHPRWGTVLLARQNMAQSGEAHPWLAQGCLAGSVAFATDGYQFFGTGHRVTGEPEAYRQERLPSQRLQYEFAYGALQIAPVRLAAGKTWNTTFFAFFQADHPTVSGPADLEEALGGLEHAISECVISASSPDWQPMVASVLQASPLAGAEPAEADWAQWFPGEHRQLERDADGGLLSFFHGEARHVVSRRKEARAERPHGHLLRSGQSLWLDADVLGSTVYAFGIFNAQVYLGNTNLARGLSVVRNPLDVMASSGQRVFTRKCGDGAWQRLAMPSAFEMALDRVRWIYRLDDTRIEAETCMDADAAVVTLTLRVLVGAPREFLVSHLLVMGDREMDQAFTMTIDSAAARIECAPDPRTLLGEKQGNLRFVIAALNPAELARCGGGELLAAGGLACAAPYAVLQSKPVREFGVAIEGRFECSVARCDANASHSGGPCALRAGKAAGPAELPENARARSARATSGCGLTTGLPRLRHAAAAHVGEILPWFAHNAWTHFTAPRGLEQYGGAAWGVRDVCQGPVEWLLATRQFAPVRRALLHVFGQQYADTNCWPQWFMLEPFRFIQSRHAHGDVPFWPLKALCDYVEATGDFAILDEQVPFTDARDFSATMQQASILSHAMLVLDVFERRRIAGTALVNYGDGDWDDTLQPVDPALRTRMVSSWTAALAYQAFGQLQRVCQRSGRQEAAARLEQLLPAMREDFQRLLPDDVLAGFMIFGEGAPRPLLHPRDHATGIRYRLLPMTRAMLAELFTPAQAAQHLALIRAHLLFPDGVRLMSDPVPYSGGEAHWFKRAETTANFGREIGLMYAHAHLRYVEALAKLGCANEMWEMLGRVTPVLLQERVRNAAPRQSNAYFSSSDAAFADRYEAVARFDELRRGAVAVKGGWRIYSSGPGLFIHRVVAALLGIRDSFGDLVLDPVLPQALDGLVAEFERDGRTIEFRYTVGLRGYGVRRVCVNGQALTLDRRENNPYREVGVRIAADAFAALLRDGVNVVELVTG